MKKQLELLRRIQTIDTAIMRSEELRKKFETDMRALDEELRRAEHQYQAEQERQQQLEREQQQRERELAAARELKKKVEERIMSVKTNKEYQAGLQEIEAIKQQIKQKEDALLESMDAGEAAKATVRKSAAELAVAKAQGEEKKRDLKSDLAAYLEDVERQQQQREALVKEVAADIFADYLRLFKVKHGRALALAEHEQCTGCSMKIPPQIYNEVVLGEKIKTCPNCNRILYVERGGDADTNQCA